MTKTALSQMMEEMAFVVHAKDHAEFERVSKELSDVMGKEYTLFYDWCSRCKQILEEKKGVSV